MRNPTEPKLYVFQCYSLPGVCNMQNGDALGIHNPTEPKLYVFQRCSRRLWHAEMHTFQICTTPLSSDSTFSKCYSLGEGCHMQKCRRLDMHIPSATRLCPVRFRQALSSTPPLHEQGGNVYVARLSFSSSCACNVPKAGAGSKF